MHRSPKRPSLVRSGGALLMAAMVFALGLLVNLPLAHAWLHATHESRHQHEACNGSSLTHTTGGLPHAEQSTPTPAPGPASATPLGHDSATPLGHDDSGCAVTLFAQGIPAPDLTPQALPPRLLTQSAAPFAPAKPEARAPGRLLPPSHAPPRSAASPLG